MNDAEHSWQMNECERNKCLDMRASASVRVAVCEREKSMVHFGSRHYAMLGYGFTAGLLSTLLR